MIQQIIKNQKGIIKTDINKPHEPTNRWSNIRRVKEWQYNY